MTDIKVENKYAWKNYYHKSEEYKQKHLSYIKQKIACPLCDHMTARANLTKHKKGKLHKRLLEAKQKLVK